MIWNIFKKDWTQLWPYAALLAVFQIVPAMSMTIARPDDFGNFSRAFELTQRGSSLIILIGGVFLIGLIALQDAIPGVRQDWLVRPIRRRDLLLAKILGVILMIHIPMFVSDMLYGILNHFSPGQSLAFAASRNLVVFAVLSLPLLSLFSFTRNFIEAIAIALIMAAGFVAIVTFIARTSWRLNWIYWMTNGSGFGWVPQTAGCLILIVGACAILALQYFFRRTRTSRVVAVLVWITFIFASFLLPWNVAFAIGEKFSSRPGLGKSVDLSFDPSGKKFKFATKTLSDSEPDMYLPLNVTGVPANSFLRADVYWTRAVFASGESRDLSLDEKADFAGNGPGYLKLALVPHGEWSDRNPRNDDRVQTQTMKLEIELWMTLFQAVDSSEMNSMGAPMKISGATCMRRTEQVSEGWDDISEMQVELGCTPVPKTYCYTAVFENPPAPYVHRSELSCAGDYRPFPGRILPGGSSISVSAFLYDPAHVVSYPTGSDELFKSKITLTEYRPVDHFKRKLVIPNVRRSDWTAERIIPLPTGEGGHQ